MTITSTRPRRRVLALAMLAACGLTAMPLAAQERANTILVLDGSGSMWGQIDGVNKITIAREVVADILKQFPKDENLGLVAYGHRQRGQCSDIETLVAPAPGTAEQIIRIVNGLNPRGMTPMTDAVIAAAQSLRHTEQAATVILVSDGIETCHADPCAAARALEEAGVDFTTHVIGFDVKGEPDALAQMQCIAKETGGRFFTADNAQELGAALQQVVSAPSAPPPPPEEPEPEPLPPASLSAPDTAVAGSVLEVAWEGPDARRDNIQIAPVGGEVYGWDYTSSGNPVRLQLPAEPGHYELRYEFKDDSSNGQVIHTRPIELTEAGLALQAPDTAVAGSMLEVTWEGPDAPRDNIQIAPVGGKEYGWAYTSSGNPVRLQLPPEPGQYELRYQYRGSNDGNILHVRPIELTEAELALQAPDAAPAGSVLEVRWSGPDAPRDNIQIAPVGGKDYYSWTYTSSGNPARVQLPFEPGRYELLYEFKGGGSSGQVIHTQPIEVTPVAVSITAPASAAAGSTIEIGWAGPNAEKDNIQIARPGGRYIHWANTSSGNPVRLKMPDEPGTYELRYSFRDRQVVQTRTITVTPAP